MAPTTALRQVIFLAIAGCASAGRVTLAINRIPRPEGGELLWLVKEPARSQFPVVLYLDGSGCASVVRVAEHMQALVREGFGVVASEKRGVEPGDDGQRCSREFLESNDRGQRLADAETMLAALPDKVPGWNGKLIVVGASEGAAIAPEIAVRHQGALVALILMGGGGWDQAQELTVLGERHGETLQDLDQQFAAMVENPIADLSWRGAANTYKRWASYLYYRPLDFLVKVNSPIYAVNGTADAATPVESAQTILTAFRAIHKTNLTLRFWEGLDHHWNDSRGSNHLRQVGDELITWLKSKALQP